MIHSKKELDFYIAADYMMNRGFFEKPLMFRVKHWFIRDYTMEFLVAMRRYSYYSQIWRRGGNRNIIHLIKKVYNAFKYKRLGLKLGFDIGQDVFGYGLLIPHYGTIVVGNSNRVGNYAVLHTSTCISGNGKVIGDALYLSTGAKLTTKLTLGNNVCVAANSVVTKSYGDNILLTGMPASIKKEEVAWYKRDGFEDRVKAIEKLKQSMNL
ncbi:MAG: hypothetical protein NC113_06410 [Bacteroides sp.]|nr:hypothetical protein [Bacteroides sp.]MCM1447838.1 hypothetical protein [Bacteroides sp.]